MSNSKLFGLTGNQLKILAVIFMTIDHIGMLLFPQIRLFRMIGRLAFPIFAYTFAEGCKYTKNRMRHFLTLSIIGFLCQIVYSLLTHSLYMNILITLSLSAAMIYSYDIAKKQDKFISYLFPAVVLVAIFFICQIMPKILDGTDFDIDYGFLGAMLPVLVYYGKTKEDKLILLSVGLLALAISSGATQLLAIFAVPILYFYNEKRGKWRMKYFFYIYYPVHIVVIFLIGLFLI